ncbi:hypothetical protein GF407_13870 [candidate division KSB1 bacterium]|nr:hypothetical protein [candidate division KSB1 bacterium]
MKRAARLSAARFLLYYFFYIFFMLFLYLNDNQFKGPIPQQLSNMDVLKNLNIRNNRFTDLPDLSAMPSLERLDVQGNRFTFEYLESNIGISTFMYSPQESVAVAKDTTITEGTSLSLSLRDY